MDFKGKTRGVTATVAHILKFINVECTTNMQNQLLFQIRILWFNNSLELVLHSLKCDGVVHMQSTRREWTKKVTRNTCINYNRQNTFDKNGVLAWQHQ